MKRFMALLIIFSLLTAVLTGCGSTAATTGSNSTSEKTVKVGIIQIVEHPALDAARKGFLETLAANGYTEGKNLTVDYKNAQGDQSTLNTIAQQFTSEKLNLVLAIATPSAQAMAAASSTIPILVTAVTDPVAAKLVNSNEKPGTNVTGTTDMNPIKQQFELLKKLVPQTKKIGVIYNAGEVNSQVQVKMAKDVAAAMGLQIVEATVASTADVQQATESLVGKVDVVYVPTDNMVVSAAPTVLQVTNKAKIPVISGESSVVDKGALGTIGINYENLGKQTGEMALQVLKGAKPQDMAIQSQKEFDTVINKSSAALLGINIPDDLKNATFVETK
ncbi:ABC transporter substrate binding protein [Desulfosporosinus acididurans]|uniref:ABC transporter substrate binding protein n=1 Tax=Desulfosporosinus acididurans TaxID=476652 RepID=A0A0J1FK68_9FIRM|nr:ABC transporter substrate-binding protein [Desulfosporosinus acididurans]KLU63855.1 ABC transporter substrate binding protein [Desulfosporosinus acididurans]